MNQIVIETYVSNGKIQIKDLPFPEKMKLTVVVTPKVELSKMSFKEIQKLTKPIKGNLSDDINSERDER